MVVGADGGDRFGVGYRPELLAGIFTHLDRIDVVEAIADEHLNHGNHLQALRTLARQVPLTLHGLRLGLAGACEVPPAKLDDFARWVGKIEPEGWSEHLAFVRAGGIEIGHLAAPSRRPASIDNALRNIARAARVVGSKPGLENVATLIDPPGSTMAEDEWVGTILRASQAPLLLDLHNLHANATSFGFDARAYLEHLPVQAIGSIHIAGGRTVRPGNGGPPRILDDHLHAVPDRVFELLEHVAERAPGPLTVILERDGAYPAIESLLHELDRARAAVSRGRSRQAALTGKAAA